MTKVAEHEELLNYAVICAMRYKWVYPGYETLDKTSLALRRGCKGTNKIQRQQLLKEAMLLNKNAEQLAKSLAKERRGMKPDELMKSEYWNEGIKKLMKQHSVFSKKAVNNSLSWCFYWGVLR